jgi:hypothetical protein
MGLVVLSVPWTSHLLTWNWWLVSKLKLQPVLTGDLYTLMANAEPFLVTLVPRRGIVLSESPSVVNGDGMSYTVHVVQYLLYPVLCGQTKHTCILFAYHRHSGDFWFAVLWEPVAVGPNQATLPKFPKIWISHLSRTKLIWCLACLSPEKKRHRTNSQNVSISNMRNGQCSETRSLVSKLLCKTDINADIYFADRLLCEDSILLGYDALSLGNRCPTFRRNVMLWSLFLLDV